MNFARVRRVSLTISLVCLATSVLSSAQTFTVVANLTGNNAYPQASLVQGVNGDFYGTSYGSSGIGYGSVFEVSTTGTVRTLYTFCSKTNCSDGGNPMAPLLLAKDLNFYGTTTSGGAYGKGTIFKLTAAGQFTTLYSFCKQTDCTDGVNAVGGLTQGTNGLLYGTSAYGGEYGEGTIFSITTGGAYTTLYSFCASYLSCFYGSQPESNLVQGSNGNLYGTTSWGTLFEFTPQNSLTELYIFCSLPSCDDGNDPVGNLALSADGLVYGATAKGGLNSGGVEWEFETSNNSYETIFDFGDNDGAIPESATLASDGNLYGTTVGAIGASGVHYPSTAFRIDTANLAFTLLYTFCQNGMCSAGGPPVAAMVQGTNGPFYGTLSNGTVYSLSTNLGPFVTTMPSSGPVASAVYILGDDLTGSTEVTFNGLPAEFAVVSRSEIKATVPKGATTGYVKVTTPHGKLTSSNLFTVP